MDTKKESYMILSTKLYSFDFVLCMDYTDKFSPYAEGVKALPEKIAQRLSELMESLYKSIKQVRVAVLSQGISTPFYDLAEEKDKITDALSKVAPTEKPNPVASLYQAMKADWIQVPKGENRKHAVIMLTDGEPSFENLPPCCPKDLPDFFKTWQNSGEGMESTMSFKHKKLFLMIPEDKASDWALFYNLDKTSPEILTPSPLPVDELADRFASQLIF